MTPTTKDETGDVHPRTGNEGPEREYGYNSTLSLTLALYGGARSTSRPGRVTPGEKEPVPNVQEAWWDPGPTWMGAEDLAPPPPKIGIRSPDRPARSDSLYRLSYRGALQYESLMPCKPYIRGLEL